MRAPPVHIICAGYLLFAMLMVRVFGVEQTFLSSSTLDAIAGALSVAAALLLFPTLRSSAKIQVSILFFIGIALLLYAYSQGGSFSIIEAFSRNTFLLTMIMSVGFLKLLLDLEIAKGELPTGPKAYFTTLVGLGIFGSVINISAPVMMCDRLAEERKIDFFTARTMIRVFCSCSSWSPYFGGTALVLTLVDNVSLVAVMLTGLPLMIITIIGTYFISTIRHPEKVAQFAGYPLSPSKLWLPIALTATVVLTQALIPSLPILVVISFAALVLTAGVMIYKLGIAPGAKTIQGHITTGLPRSANELNLFISAGVLATGLTAFLSVTNFQITLTEYTLTTACITLAGMILIAGVGIHPVIQISVLTPLLLPINPDPELLAMTYLFSWGLGNASSPLSGTNLIFQGRYGISAWQGALQNWPYVIPMYFVAIALMALLMRFS